MGHGRAGGAGAGRRCRRGGLTQAAAAAAVAVAQLFKAARRLRVALSAQPPAALHAPGSIARPLVAPPRAHHGEDALAGGGDLVLQGAAPRRVSGCAGGQLERLRLAAQGPAWSPPEGTISDGLGARNCAIGGRQTVGPEGRRRRQAAATRRAGAGASAQPSPPAAPTPTASLPAPLTAVWISSSSYWPARTTTALRCALGAAGLARKAPWVLVNMVCIVAGVAGCTHHNSKPSRGEGAIRRWWCVLWQAYPAAGASRLSAQGGLHRLHQLPQSTRWVHNTWLDRIMHNGSKLTLIALNCENQWGWSQQPASC